LFDIEAGKALMHRDPVYLIFLPQGLGRVKRLTLPKPLISFAMGLFLFCTLPISYVLFDYWSAKQIEGQLAKLETENREQRAQLMHMAGKIVLLADRLAESEALTVHDRPITGIRGALKSLSIREQKPEQPAALISDLLASAQYENMVRQMHEGLDYLNAEINALVLLRDGDTFKLALHTGEPAEKAISGKKAAKAFRRTIIKSRLRTIARELGLAPRLALGMAQVESGFDHGAVSPRGAIGVMQVMPQLAGERFEVEPEMLFDPEVNIRVGLLHMKYLLDRFNDNLDLSLAAYNAGARRVVLAGYRVPHITETREYVKRVKQAMNDYVAPTTWEE
jgi:soluble lytic murein transglycosylase-like protein